MEKKINKLYELFAILDDGGYVITPNNRLCNYFINEYVAYKQQTVIAKPNCLSYNQFLEKIYITICDNHIEKNYPALLTGHQEQLLFRQVLANSYEATIPDGLLQEVMSAYAHVEQWEIDVNSANFKYNPETEQFQNWHQAFSAILKEKNLLTAPLLAPFIRTRALELKLKSICWAHFNYLTPQQKSLNKDFASTTEICSYDHAFKNNTPYVYKADDEAKELTEALNFAKEGIQKERHVAIIVPDLNAQKEEIATRLSKHFKEDQYNISMGSPLLDQPLVIHALTFLSLKDEITNLDARVLVTSPFIIGATTEFYERAAIIENNKLFTEKKINLNKLINALAHTCPTLYEILTNLAKFPKKATPSDWCGFFIQRLRDLGFASEFPLQSDAYQSLMRFMSIFTEFRKLEVVMEEMTKAEALFYFKNILQKTIFQPEKKSPKLQILGLIEADGLAFDDVWIMGMTDATLPAPTNLSPFIPIHLQKELNMPQANVHIEIELAKLYLERRLNSADKLILSYPEIIGDLPCMPSPIIKKYQDFMPSEKDLKRDVALESLHESYLIPFKACEKIAGGTTLLANQAKCPFKAFAAHRLHAKKGLSLSIGPDPIERGQIMHQILEITWGKLKSQQQLLQTSDAELEKIIDKAIDIALQEKLTHKSHSFNSNVKNIEKKRLQRLTKCALEFEKTRKPFQIYTTEGAFSITLANIEFKVRVDRIDKVDNNLWVIDYKSTMPQQKPWYEERPEEPQMLVYALLEEKINTLMFMQLKADEISLNGISAEELPLKGVISIKEGESFAEITTKWHQELSKLATEFQNGIISPTPKRSSICNFCDYPHLCRATVAL